jgi:hypothetical protein
MSGNGTIEVPSSFMLAGLEHEYGYYLDQLLNGSFRYNFDVAPASLFNQLFSPSTHDDYWTEVEANQLAVKFFGPNSAIATTPEYPTK